MDKKNYIWKRKKAKYGDAPDKNKAIFTTHVGYD